MLMIHLYFSAKLDEEHQLNNAEENVKDIKDIKDSRCLLTNLYLILKYQKYLYKDHMQIEESFLITE